MSPRLRRTLITLFVTGISVGLVITVIMSRPGPAPTPADGVSDSTPTDMTAAGLDGGLDTGAPVDSTDPLPTSDDGVAQAEETAGGAPPVDPPASGDLVSLEGLRARRSTDGDTPLEAIGSLDPRAARLLVEFTRFGAGITRIALSDEWDTAARAQEARSHWNAVEAGDADPPPLPDERHRYILAAVRMYGTAPIPVFGAYALEINGTLVNLLYDVETTTDEATGIASESRLSVWSADGPGTFTATIVNTDNEPIARVRRAFKIGHAFGLTLEQSIENLTPQALNVRWIQYGPAELDKDKWGYIPRRRFRFGYLWGRDTTGGVYADRSMMVERVDLFKGQKDSTLWPNEDSVDQGYELSWFASVNRYFALAVHPTQTQEQGWNKSLAGIIDTIGHDETSSDQKTGVVLTHFYSPLRTLAPNSSTSLDFDVYAGPLERSVFAAEPYSTLSMGKMILYQMSSCCTICTFPWLADLLLNFLSFAHKILGDWGVAIILLVCVVRLLLHPLTKKGQISMQRFSKQMSELKPEIDKLQKKYPNDPKKLQQEQMRLMRERGINPAQFLGCAPMFLQMPIWIALYAMLYFAKEIHQQPAFYGVFQKLSGGAWEFLGDLSRADRFIPLFDEPKTFSLFLQFDYSSINILPLVMGVLFFLQQKYMSPPPSPSMTKEQLQQQKIMKIMMVVMMPVFLYSAPSGLTLYILTSSTIGILESRRIRAHVAQMDLEPTKKKELSPKAKKRRDAIGKAYAEALDRRKQQQAAKQNKPKSYKKRKK
ncbi:MAG: YidC/Oxa1 family insertase periplasmic-domain containing protein [Planctomycetota bacterium]|jgi:YidC/Oxa1 family membrane protein insertase